MSMDPKSTAAPGPAALPPGSKGVRIFTYPKIIFIFPTMIVALICGIGMRSIGDKTIDPTKDARRTRRSRPTRPRRSRRPRRTAHGRGAGIRAVQAPRRTSWACSSWASSPSTC